MGELLRFRSVPSRSQILVISLLMTVLGVAAVGITVADLRAYLAYDLSPLEVHPTALPIALGPACFGLLLVLSSLRILGRRPNGALLLSLTLLVGAVALTLRRFSFVGVERPSMTAPPSIFFTTEGLDDGTLWTTMEFAAIGLLSLLSAWIPDPKSADTDDRECDVLSSQDHAVVADSSAS